MCSACNFDKFMQGLIEHRIAGANGLWSVRDGEVKCPADVLIDLHHPDSLDTLEKAYENCLESYSCRSCPLA